jgi:hypothetical protein
MYFCPEMNTREKFLYIQWLDMSIINASFKVKLILGKKYFWKFSSDKHSNKKISNYIQFVKLNEISTSVS